MLRVSPQRVGRVTGRRAAQIAARRLASSSSHFSSISRVSNRFRRRHARRGRREDARSDERPRDSHFGLRLAAGTLFEPGAPSDRRPRTKPIETQTGTSDPVRALHDEWAAFPYSKLGAVELHRQRGGGTERRAARARIVHTTTSASIRAAKNGAPGAALGDKTAGQQ